MQLKFPAFKKYKKYHKQQLNLTPTNGRIGRPAAGSYKLVSAEPGRLASRHFETIKKSLRRFLKKSGKIWIPGFPHLPISAKPLEVRMGKGKGAVKYWAMPVRSGSTIVELSGVSAAVGFKALSIVQQKLPFKSKIVLFQD